MTRTTLLIALALFTACNGEDDPGDGETEATGTAAYSDSGEDASGAPTEPESPDSFVVQIRAEGTGTFDVSEPQCEADALTGAFSALYEGDATVDNDGIYVASLTVVEAETPSGCELPDLDIGVVTDVVIRGEVEATTRNCETYCESKARASAETQCEGDANEAGCRSTQEAAYEASCTTSCTSSTNVIVAETSLTATALSSLDLAALTGAALGEVTADLTFDHVEDSDGDTVDEAP